MVPNCVCSFPKNIRTLDICRNLIWYIWAISPGKLKLCPNRICYDEQATSSSMAVLMPRKTHFSNVDEISAQGRWLVDDITLYVFNVCLTHSAKSCDWSCVS